MKSISVIFANGKEIPKEIYEIVDKKIVTVRANISIYISLLEIFHDNFHEMANNISMLLESHSMDIKKHVSLQLEKFEIIDVNIAQFLIDFHKFINTGINYYKHNNKKQDIWLKIYNSLYTDERTIYEDNILGYLETYLKDNDKYIPFIIYEDKYYTKVEYPNKFEISDYYQKFYHKNDLLEYLIEVNELNTGVDMQLSITEPCGEWEQVKIYDKFINDKIYIDMVKEEVEKIYSTYPDAIIKF